MFFRTCLLLCAIGTVPALSQHRVVVADCKQSRNTGGYTGRLGWEDAPAGSLIGASEDRTVGNATLICTWRSAPARRIEISMGKLHISFGGASDATPGSGVVFELLADGKPVYVKRFLRIAGEDWIESGARTYSVDLPSPARKLSFLLRLVDESASGSIRADLQETSIAIKAASPEDRADK